MFEAVRFASQHWPLYGKSGLPESRIKFFRKKTAAKCLAENGPAQDRVVGLGGSVVDYLALVAKYPKPDEKIRTEELKIQGGGNCGNALTAAAKLGLKSVLLTKLGDDAVGVGALRELEADNVDISNVIVAKGCPSPFTYILVDREEGTRTCIHTPSEPLMASEITPAFLDQALSGAGLTYFDGRFAEAALVVAKEARRRGIPVLVEAEKLRPNLNLLLEYADYIITSANFPQEMTGADCLGDALLSLVSRYPNAGRITTTLGARGCVALENSPEALMTEDLVALDDFLTKTWMDTDNQKELNGSTLQAPVGAMKNGVDIRCGSVLSSQKNLFLWKHDTNKERSDLKREMALPEPASNEPQEDGDTIQEYSASRKVEKSLPVSVWVATSAGIDKEFIQDTTGAGDAFIGASIYGILNSMSVSDTLRLASVAAACKCTGLGARASQATLADISPELLCGRRELVTDDCK